MGKSYRVALALGLPLALLVVTVMLVNASPCMFGVCGFPWQAPDWIVCSRELVSDPCSNATDGNDDTGWRSGRWEYGEWFDVDSATFYFQFATPPPSVVSVIATVAQGIPLGNFGLRLSDSDDGIYWHDVGWCYGSDWTPDDPLIDKVYGAQCQWRITSGRRWFMLDFGGVDSVFQWPLRYVVWTIAGAVVSYTPTPTTLPTFTPTPVVSGNYTCTVSADYSWQSYLGPDWQTVEEVMYPPSRTVGYYVDASRSSAGGEIKMNLLSSPNAWEAGSGNLQNGRWCGYNTDLNFDSVCGGVSGSPGVGWPLHNWGESTIYGAVSFGWGENSILGTVNNFNWIVTGTTSDCGVWIQPTPTPTQTATATPTITPTMTATPYVATGTPGPLPTAPPMPTEPGYHTPVPAVTGTPVTNTGWLDVPSVPTYTVDLSCAGGYWIPGICVVKGPALGIQIPPLFKVFNGFSLGFQTYILTEFKIVTLDLLPGLQILEVAMVVVVVLGLIRSFANQSVAMGGE